MSFRQKLLRRPTRDRNPRPAPLPVQGEGGKQYMIRSCNSALVESVVIGTLPVPLLPVRPDAATWQHTTNRIRSLKTRTAGIGVNVGR